MSLIYEREVRGSAVHALVVGVGAYPWAKPGASPYGSDTPAHLRKLPDLNSAPAGARRFADWLIWHADHLPAPLASVELAVSAPPWAPPGNAQYEWKARIKTPGADPRGASTAVSFTDGNSILEAGKRWASRLQATPDQIAVFYICGHGTAVPTRSVVWLSDVAGPDYRSAWEPFVDVQYLAGVISRLPTLKEGYLFIDACQEIVADVVFGELDEAVNVGHGLEFFVRRGLTAARNKVLLLVPGPVGTIAFDDGEGGGGRFTHVLIEALNGAAARNYTGAGHWGVVIDSLPRAMKILYRLRGWPLDGFDPTPVRMLLTATPIVCFPTPPKVRFAVMLDPPEAINQASCVCLQDAAGQPIVTRPCTDRAELWVGEAHARMGLCYVHAEFNGSYKTPVDLSEMRVEPIIVHRVAR
jgi:Caspase domain